MSTSPAVEMYNRRGPRRQDMLEQAQVGRERQFAALPVGMLPALYLAMEQWSACLTGDMRTVAYKEQCLEALYAAMDDAQRDICDHIQMESDALVALYRAERG